jgi:polygalacturonase
MIRRLFILWVLFSTVVAQFDGVPALAQDGRGVQPQPVIPQNCPTKVVATKTIISTTAYNVDPWNPTISTPGVLGGTGGTSWEPSSETLDTNLQTAINAAAAGSCVEVVQGTGGQFGLVLGKWKPVNSGGSGVVVVIDSGITLFASRNPSDYGGSTCGTLPTSSHGSSCTPWIEFTSGAQGAAIMGYGVLDGRCWDTFTTGGQGFCSNRVQTYCNSHGHSWAGITCPSATNYGVAYGPNMMDWEGSCSSGNCQNILYGITLKDSGNFNILFGYGLAGFTAWDISILSAAEVSNTDGIDPSYCATNFTLRGNNISMGDNHISLKANSSKGPGCATASGSILTNQTGAGIGITFGYESTAKSGPGITGIVIDGLVQKASNNNPNQQVGHGIWDQGSGQAGSVTNSSFNHSCLINYAGKENSLKYQLVDSSNPYFTGISESNTTILGNTNALIEGSSGHPSAIALNNVTTGTVTGGYQYVTTSGSNVSFTPSGTGVTNTITNPGGNTPYPCTTSSWQPLWGNMTMEIAGQSNYTSYTSPGPTQAVTLQATILPSTAINTKESTALSQPVAFYDNGTLIGTAVLGHNSTYSALTVTATSGTHVYTARYSGDSNYSGLVYNFGSLTMQVGGASVPPSIVGPVQFQGKVTIQ